MVNPVTRTSTASVSVWRRYIRPVLYVLLALLLVYFFTLTPTHEGEWSPLQQRLPLVEADENDVETHYRIHHVRDFRYNDDGSVHSADYRAKIYVPADLQQVWFGISHFGNHGLAHTFLSFEFTGDHFLAASIEARMRPLQHYNPVKGLLRQYNKLVVLGTEADIIGLRTHIRKERVLLYPLQLSAAQRDYLFKAIIKDAQAIDQKPAFYNTLFDNCATNLLKHDPEYRFYTSLADYRLLLPGFSDEVVQEKGWIDPTKSIADLRLTAQIDLSHVDVDAENFSRAIRQGWARH
jgi:hypothetical protein